MNRPEPASTHSQRATSPYARWLTSSLLLPLLAGTAIYNLANHQDVADQVTNDATTIQPLPAPMAAPAEEKSPATTLEYVIKPNDTLEQVFRRNNLSLNDLAAIRTFPDVRQALDVLRPGDSISLSYIDGALQSLKRRLSNTEVLAVTRSADGFKSQVINTPIDIKVVTVHGVVDSSLYASAREAGLSADVIMRLANDIFGWDIDFALDIRHGDEFTVTYEQQYRDKEYLGDGRILAAEFINDGQRYRAIHYVSDDGKIDNYFTPEGRSMHKQFLRAPVDFTRISSGFTLARFHPILNRIRAHKGIDYAAPTGTPVKAAGDGKVEFVGRKGGYGNAIILDHGAGITTLYGHLSRFAKIHAGTHVTQGEIIGYVGQTGLATGPHLHYEYRVNGVYKNPRTVPLPDASPIPMSYMAEFHQQADKLLAALDRGMETSVAAAAPGVEQHH